MYEFYILLLQKLYFFMVNQVGRVGFATVSLPLL